MIAVTGDASEPSRWSAVGPWLTQTAAQFAPTSAGAFGAQGIAMQNLQNSIALGAQAQAQRAWSEALQADVTQRRDRSDARIADDRRQGLGGVERYDDPYTGQPWTSRAPGRRTGCTLPPGRSSPATARTSTRARPRTPRGSASAARARADPPDGAAKRSRGS